MDLKNISLLVEATTDEIYAKFYSDVPREEFDRVIAIDPTYNAEQHRMGDFGKWLITLYKKGEDLSDEQEIKDQLTIFKRNKNKLPPEQKDIFRLKSLHDLIELNDAAERANKSELQTKAEQHPGANFVCKSDKWEVYEPTTYEASKWLRGDDAVWCTGRHDDTSYWRSYTRDGGRLFIFINMDKENADKNSIKYQVAITADNRVREFRDARNNSADFATFISDDSLFKALGSTDIAKTAEYKAVKEFKETNGVITYSKLMAIKYTGDSVSSLYKLLCQEIKVIIVNDGISYIVEDAFKDMSAQKIILPDSIRQIGERAFIGCRKLKTIKIPPRVSIIPRSCFDGCSSLQSVEFGINVLEFKPGAFANTPTDIKLITPTHRMRVPMSEKHWYEQHISRLPKQEESLKEDFEGSVPDWLAPFLTRGSTRYFGGYSHSSRDLGMELRNKFNVDLNNVKFKRLTKPRTKADLINILDDSSKIPLFYIPQNADNKQLCNQLNDNRNWNQDIGDIIYVPGLGRSPSIGYYSPDNFDNFSKQKLFNLLNGAKDTKFVYIDKNDKTNFLDKNKIDTRKHNAESSIYDRGQGQEYRPTGHWKLVIKPEFLEQHPDARTYWGERPLTDEERSYDSKKDALRDLARNSLSVYEPGEGRARKDYAYKDLFNLVNDTSKKPEVFTPGYHRDLSGYHIDSIRNNLKRRLNDYRREHYSETLDKMSSDIETCKSKIQDMFSSSLSDAQSIQDFNYVLSKLSECIKNYNKLISNLDIALMQEDEEKRANLLNQIFAFESYESKLRPTVKEVREDIRKLKDSLEDVEVAYIESLKRK